MSGYRVWSGEDWIEVPVAAMGGESLVVPNVAAVVRNSSGSVLLQRRDKPNEPVRGLFEVPTGRWRAGESAVDAVVREVEEETGLEVTPVDALAGTLEAHAGRPFEALRPVAVVNGVGGAYPALILAFACRGDGDPRPLPGETADPAWYPEQEVRAMVANSPESFTSAAALVLKVALG